jgi:serine/threonine-protein kinase
MPAPEETIGPFRLLRVVSSGQGTTVYAAERIGARHLGRIALKVLDEGAAEALVGRLRHEANVLGRIDHPFVARLLDHGVTSGGRQYLAAELVRGRTLRSIMEESGQVNVARAVSIAMQALSGLGRAHQMGIVHGAIDPDCVLVEQGVKETVKLIGFGGALFVKDDTSAALPRRGRDQDDTPATGEDGAVAARAIPYASPERLLGKHVDGRADIWSVAVCLYEALAGVHPFAVHSHIPIASAIAALEPPPLRSFRADVDFALEAVIRRALEKQPIARFQTTEEVIKGIAVYGRPGAVHLPMDRRSAPPRQVIRPPVAKPAVRPVVQVDEPAASLALRVKVLAPSVKPGFLRSAVLHEGATSALAATSEGFLAWSLDDGWVEQHWQGEGVSVRGVAVSPAGDSLAFGEGGLAMLLPHGGHPRSLGVPESMRVDAACIVDEGHAVLVGVDGRGGEAVLVELRGDDLRTRPFRPSTHVASVAAAGDGFVACGDGGLFVHFHSSVAAARTSGTYDWRGIAVDIHGGGVVVGKRGRLLGFSPDGQPEATTHYLGVAADLTCASVAQSIAQSVAQTVLWAAGDGIVLRRDEHGTWQSAPVGAAVLAMAAEANRACLLFDDGAVHEVHLAG